VCDTITCDTITATNINGTADTFNSTLVTDAGLYRVSLSNNNNTNPHPFYQNSDLLYKPTTKVLSCVASNIFSKIDISALPSTALYPLYFGLDILADGSNEVYQTSFVTYQPSNDRLVVKNMNFTGVINGVSVNNFSNIPKIALLYDGLGGNNTAGESLPTWDDEYSEITFPTNIWILGNLTLDDSAYFNKLGNIFNYPVHLEDTTFNTRNSLQINIQSDGTTAGGTGVAGIQFNSWGGRTNASCQIYALDNANYSGDLCFVTAPSGSDLTIPVERMRIMADGNIGIGNSAPAHTLHVTGEIKCTNRLITDKVSSITNGNIVFDTYPSGVATDRLRILSNGNIGMGVTTPTVKLDVSGSVRASSTVFTTNITSISATASGSIFGDKTTGAINIGGAMTTGGAISLGNILTGLNSVNLYGKTFCYNELQANQGIDCNSYEARDPNVGLTIGTSMGAGNGTITIGTAGTTTNNMDLNALTGTLSGNWNSATPTTGDNSTKIATTEFVQNTLSGGSSFLALNSTTTQVVNSTVGFIGQLTTSTPYARNVVGSGSLQHDNVICSDDGEIVYTFANTGKILYGSFDFGITWRALYTHSATTTINNIACNGSGKYVFISFASQAFQYSFNFGNTFQAITISAITTYYPITNISCSFEPTGNFYVGVTNNNTALSRVDIYVSTTGPTGSFTAGNLPGNTSRVLSHCFTNTNMLISSGLGQEVWANPQPYNASLTIASNVVFSSGGTINAKIRSNNGGNFVQIGAANLYQSRQYGLTGYVTAASSSTRATSVNRNGTIFLYSSGANLYISNNQYSQKITYGSTLPVYTLMYTASGTITDVWISGNGLKGYLTVSGQLDRIYNFDIQGPLGAYQTDFIIDKDRQIVRSHLPSDITGNFANAFLPYKITQVGGDFTIAQPFTQYYQLNGTSNFTITLPAITEYFIGLEFKMYQTQSKTVTINCNTSDNIIHPKNPLVLTDTTYSYSVSTNYNGISLMAIYSPSSAKMFAWMII
jgi:hypothetical protein